MLNIISCRSPSLLSMGVCHGIDSHVEYFSHFPDFVTIMEKPFPTEICSQSHSMNEIVGYHLQIFYLIIGIGLFLIILILEERNYE